MRVTLPSMLLFMLPFAAALQSPSSPWWMDYWRETIAWQNAWQRATLVSSTTSFQLTGWKGTLRSGIPNCGGCGRWPCRHLLSRKPLAMQRGDHCLPGSGPQAGFWPAPAKLYWPKVATPKTLTMGLLGGNVLCLGCGLYQGDIGPYGHHWAKSGPNLTEDL